MRQKKAFLVMKVSKLICIASALISILCFMNFKSSGQSGKNSKVPEEQKIICKVFYNFVYLKFKALPENIYREELELDLGRTASMFFSHSGILKDSARQRASDLQANQIPIDQQTMNLLTANASNDQFYTFANGSYKVIHIQHIVTSTYLVLDTAFSIQWKVLDSTKEIQGNLCQKAIGESHGRTYIVWFCNDLPFSFGPRRLNGLPGLILEAYDEQREIVYTLNRIERNVRDGKLVLPSDGISATYKEYNRVLALFEKDPAAFVNRLNGPGSKTIAVMHVSSNPKLKAERPKPPTMNPIDLR